MIDQPTTDAADDDTERADPFEHETGAPCSDPWCADKEAAVASEPTTDPRAAILKAVIDRALAIESARAPLPPLADAHQRVQDAAEPQPADTADSGPFADALVDLAANCLVRLVDLAQMEGIR